MLFTRRELGKMALAGLPAAGMLVTPGSALAGMLAAKPNSKWAGVQIGMNVPYNFKTGNNLPADEVLQRTVQLGVSAIELRSQPVELFLGSPALTAAVANAARGGAARGGAGAAGRGRAAGAAADGEAAAAGEDAGAGGRRAGGGGRAAATPPTPQEEAATRAAAEDLRKWRMSVPMSKVKELRKKYNDAGVDIEIVKYDGILQFTDDTLDYAFELAKNLGARAISCELPVDQVPASKRLGQFAEKHKMLIGFHGHTAMTPAIWEASFALSKANGANLDIGHFVGGNKTSPIPFLKQHHDRITHLHIKDKTLQNVNVEFGKGDTPVKEALQLIRDQKWNIQGTIEFEYPVPAGSDVMTELTKTVDFCKNCLLS